MKHLKQKKANFGKHGCENSVVMATTMAMVDFKMFKYIIFLGIVVMFG